MRMPMASSLVASLSQSASRRLKRYFSLPTAGTQSATMLFSWVILGKCSQSLGQNRDLFPLDERGAGADALLGAAAGVQGDAGDAVIQHLFHKVGTGEARIAVSEVEAVGDGLTAVFVVSDVEAVVGEGFLHQLSLAAVFQHVVTIAVGAVVDSLHHSGQCVLG